MWRMMSRWFLVSRFFGRLRFVRTLAAACVVLSVPVYAQYAQATDDRSVHTRQVASLSHEDLSDIARVEEYLNSVSTVQARFVQVSSTGQSAEGELFLSRPGDLRIDYDPPVPVLMVTSGAFLVYYDKELDQTTHVPISTTPAAVLVDERVELNGEDVRVTGVNKSANSIRISVVLADDPLAGMMTLMFSDAPLTLRQWAVRDAQGVSTELFLVSPRFGIDIDPGLFTFEHKPVINERR